MGRTCGYDEVLTGLYYKYMTSSKQAGEGQGDRLTPADPVENNSIAATAYQSQVARKCGWPG